MSIDQINLDHITRTITETGEAAEWAYNGFVYLDGALIATDHGSSRAEVEDKQRRYVDRLMEKYVGN